MMRTSVRSQRELAFLFFLMRVTNASTDSLPRPMPAKEWMVTPPILHAAIPERSKPTIHGSRYRPPTC